MIVRSLSAKLFVTLHHEVVWWWGHEVVGLWGCGVCDLSILRSSSALTMTSLHMLSPKCIQCRILHILSRVKSASVPNQNSEGSKYRKLIGRKPPRKQSFRIRSINDRRQSITSHHQIRAAPSSSINSVLHKDTRFVIVPGRRLHPLHYYTTDLLLGIASSLNSKAS